MRPCFLTALSAASFPFPCFDGDEFAVNQAREEILQGTLLPGFDDSDYNRHLLPNGGSGPAAEVNSQVVEAVSTPEPVEVTMSRSSERSQGSTPDRNANSSAKSPGCQTGETRAEKLERIRREIELGIYDTPERFEAAFERMLEKISV